MGLWRGEAPDVCVLREVSATQVTVLLPCAQRSARATHIENVQKEFLGKRGITLSKSDHFVSGSGQWKAVTCLRQSRSTRSCIV